jgi:hypothetical protein
VDKDVVDLTEEDIEVCKSRGFKFCIKPAVSDISDKVKNIDLIDAENRNKLDKLGYPKLEEIEEIKESCKESFSALKQTRIYTEILKDLRKKRTRIFGRMYIKDYKDLVLEHIRTMEKIFRDKNYNEYKRMTIISKGLSPLEARITGYGHYFETHIDPFGHDPIPYDLNIVLNLVSEHAKEYVPYKETLNKICSSSSYYNSALFSFREEITRFLFNRYGFNNVVYVPLVDNTEDDPYSFYRLNRVKKDKRYWLMDCRLEWLADDLINCVLPNLVILYRRIWRDVFGNNDYRPDFRSNFDFIGRRHIFDFEGDKLLGTMILMAKPVELCNVLRELVKNNSTYNFTDNDFYNRDFDYDSQKRRFREEKKEKEVLEDIVDVIKPLFDGISDEDAVGLYHDHIHAINAKQDKWWE